MDPATVVSALRRANDVVAMAVGALLLAWVALILAEVVLRRLGLGALGGTDEPLWIPQTLCWSGWVWFGAVSLVLWIAAAMLMRGDTTAVDGAIGARDETEDAA